MAELWKSAMRNRSWVRLVFTLLMCSTLAQPNDIATKSVTIRKIAPCPSTGRKLAIVVDDVIIARSRGNAQSVRATLDVKEDIKNQSYMIGDIIKCDVNGNPDHCEYVIKNYNMTNVCEFITAKDEVWSVAFESLDQPFNCPIKKGFYQMKEVLVSKEMLEFAPSSNAIWKAQYRGYEGNVNIFCVDLEMLVKMVHPRTGRGRRQ
ncbi:uncharacterized protein [Atheta coriaria]|uniref:uncharacterized protein n=1 Tax=Dalotia coriaria TaxID=877792 RepID=UPI0031F4321A